MDQSGVSTRPGCPRHCSQPQQGNACWPPRRRGGPAPVERASSRHGSCSKAKDRRGRPGSAAASSASMWRTVLDRSGEPDSGAHPYVLLLPIIEGSFGACLEAEKGRWILAWTCTWLIGVNARQLGLDLIKLGQVVQPQAACTRGPCGPAGHPWSAEV